MRSLALIAVFAVGVTSAASAFAATYRWVDSSGIVHYSDRPAPGAVLIERREAQTFSAPSSSARSSVSGSTTTASAAAAPAESYRALEVFRPTNDETISNSGNQVSVRLRLEPDLRNGDSIWLYVDGKRVDGLPTTGTEFTIRDVVRGTHTLTAIVADSQGAPRIQSAPVKFHMRQVSLLTRPGT